MMVADTSQALTSDYPVTLQALAKLPDPWSGFLLPVAGFPQAEPDRTQYKSLFQQFTQKLRARHNLQHEAALQVWKVLPGAGAEELNDHVQLFAPQKGLGIWPDREPPQGWSQEALSDAAASYYSGEEMLLPSHKMLRLGTPEASREEAVNLMRGLGLVAEMFHETSFAQIAERSRQQYLPGIRERRFQRARFYWPLLDRATLQAVQRAAQLDDWLCGATVCVRESSEDAGYLVLTRVPIDSILQDAAKVLGYKLDLQ